ncbi:MAG: alpha/beta family hydrolase [Ilumatobacteraceae bacterium]
MTRVRAVVLFPGSGSAANHPSLVTIENHLSPLPTFRCDFDYRKAGKSFPDRTPVLLTTVRREVRAVVDGLGCETGEIVIGGRSMGGRMCSMAACDPEDALEVAGVICISYPLHPPKKPESLRTEHFPRLGARTLFVSGTKDEFGTPEELGRAFELLPRPPDVVWMDGARHDLARRDVEVARVIGDWLATF